MHYKKVKKNKKCKKCAGFDKNKNAVVPDNFDTQVVWAVCGDRFILIRNVCTHKLFTYSITMLNSLSQY